MKLELPGRRERGRPQRKFMAVTKEDVQRAAATEEKLGRG